MRMARLSFLAEALTWHNVSFHDANWFRLMDLGVDPCWKTRPRTWLWLRLLLVSVMAAVIVQGLAVTASRPAKNCDTPLGDGEGEFADEPGTSLLPWYPAYATRWGAILQFTQVLAGALATGVYFVPVYASAGDAQAQAQAPARQPFLVTVAWVSMALVSPLTLLNVSLYWTLVARRALAEDVSAATFANRVLEHSVTFAVLLVDMKLSYEPFLLAGSYLLGVALTFAFLTWLLVHYFAGLGDGKCNDYIYPFIDWNHPVSASVFSFSAMAFGPALSSLACFYLAKWVRPPEQRAYFLGHAMADEVAAPQPPSVVGHSADETESV